MCAFVRTYVYMLGYELCFKIQINTAIGAPRELVVCQANQAYILVDYSHARLKFFIRQSYVNVFVLFRIRKFRTRKFRLH